MQVLMFSWEYPPEVEGGIAAHVSGLAHQLVRTGHTVYVITTTSGDKSRIEEDRGVHILRHPRSQLPPEAAGPSGPDGFAFLSQVIKTNFGLVERALELLNSGTRIDIIHAHDWLVKPAATTIKKAYHLPLVATIHATEHGRNNGIHTDLQQRIHEMEWELTYEAWRVICCSQYMKRELEAVFQLPPSKIDVIPNAVDIFEPNAEPQALTHFKERFAPAGEKLVLFVGRAVYEKGIQDLLRSFPAVLSVIPGTRLVIVGKGYYLNTLQQMADDLGIADKVIFTSFVSSEEKWMLYRIADVAVVPSHYEPFGIVALEAMATGTPVVASAVGGLAEIVRHEVNGVTIYPQNPGSIAWGILRVLQDEALRQRITYQAAHDVRNNYTWSKVGIETLKVYEGVISDYQSKPWSRAKRQPLTVEAIPRGGSLVFLLHSHMPYVSNYPHHARAEEWLYEAILETYLPLLGALEELKSVGHVSNLTISFTPVLLEQLADKDVMEGFDFYLEDHIKRANDDMRRFVKQGSGLASLALDYLNQYEKMARLFRETYSRDIIGAYRAFQEQGSLEIMVSAATHGYLPLLSPESVRAQIEMGLTTYQKYFGEKPAGFWLPECGYFPGLAKILSKYGIRYFVVERHAIDGGEPRPLSSHVIFHNGSVQWVPPSWPAGWNGSSGTTYKAYLAEGETIAVVARNEKASAQVWSAHLGYPGDPFYREFHKKDDISNLKYWRVTGLDIDLGAKQVYEPLMAAERVEEHSRHFVNLCNSLLQAFAFRTGETGLIVAPFDAELFGHWWHEGVEWLKKVVSKARVADLSLKTMRQAIAAHPPRESITLPESSWGIEGGHKAWLNPATEDIWEDIRTAEETMSQLASEYAEARGVVRDVLEQMGRELLLMESSDWTFLITTGQSTDYARDRFYLHRDRFIKLRELLSIGVPDSQKAKQVLEEINKADHIFPQLDYRLFRKLC